jgi:5'-deoxynucleotidase YfbR-like HD superfamily hydrolase
MYKLLTNQERVKFLREASDVQRLHVIRTIGEYSNGQHSFNMLAMLKLLWPEAPVELVWTIVEHDIPERVIGDVPSPALHHVYQESLPAVVVEEIHVMEEIYGRSSDFHGISDDLNSWLKGLDILELYLYTKDQFQLGNKNLETMRLAIEERFKRDAGKFPTPILNLYHECKNSDWTFLPDLGVDK